MKNQVIKTPTKGKEYFGFTDTDIVVSSKKHKDIDSLIAASEKSGMLETVSHIKLSNVNELIYNEKNSILKIKHQKDTKEKKFTIGFNNSQTRNAVATSLSEIKGLNKNFTAEGKIKPLMISLFFIAVASMIAVALGGIAYEAANGGEIEQFSGRRSGLKNLLASAATALGPIGVGILGGLGVLFLVYRAVKRWQNPANDISYS